MNVFSIGHTMTLPVVLIPACMFAYGGADAHAAGDPPLDGSPDSVCPLILGSPHRAFTGFLWCRG
jgi:hypothetical protein